MSQLIAAGSASAQTPPPAEVGVWFDDTGDGAVEIHSCGAKALCGRIVWLKKPINDQGEPLHDRYNPDPSLRSRPICGLPILTNLIPMTDGSWDRGTVYDPKKGSSHEAAIKLLRPDKLQLTGFGLGRLLSKSFIWTRAPADLQVCTELKSAPAAAPVTAPKAPAATGRPTEASAKKSPAPVPAGATAAVPPSVPATPAAKTEPPATSKKASPAAAAAIEPTVTKTTQPATSAPASAAKPAAPPSSASITAPAPQPASKAAAPKASAPASSGQVNAGDAASAGAPQKPLPTGQPGAASAAAAPNGLGAGSAAAATREASADDTPPASVSAKPRRKNYDAEPVGGLVTLPRP